MKITGETPRICEDIPRVEALQPGGVSADMTGQGRSRAQGPCYILQRGRAPRASAIAFRLDKEGGLGLYVSLQN